MVDHPSGVKIAVQINGQVAIVCGGGDYGMKVVGPGTHLDPSYIF